MVVVDVMVAGFSCVVWMVVTGDDCDRCGGTVAITVVLAGGLRSASKLSQIRAFPGVRHLQSVGYGTLR